MERRRIIVCDYENPKGYTFPSFGFGSSEKRIWHFAKIASELGHEVVVTGPLWLPEHVPLAEHFPKRLSAETVDEFLAAHGRFDYLFAGHEYFDKLEWVEPFSRCAETLLSYQLHPYRYARQSFDGKKRILFCYSDQMVSDYADQAPVKALLFHSGVGEEPAFAAEPEGYLLWIGRLDRDKAPHYAVAAAKQLGVPLVILGKTVYQPDYFEARREEFSSPGVRMLGVKFGAEKMRLIAGASAALYTTDRNYREAGAGVLGEILSSGVPVAGITWSGNDAVCEAVNHPELGVVERVDQTADEAAVASALARATRGALQLDRRAVRRRGARMYNPHLLVARLIEMADSRRAKKW